jgi:ribosomal protein L1
MPFGLGKTKKIAIFINPELREKAVEFGADIIGDEKLLKNVIFNF